MFARHLVSRTLCRICIAWTHLCCRVSLLLAKVAYSSLLARLFDLLVSQFQYVVVDCSNRMDALSKLVADLANVVLLVTQADVVSLWSASRVHSFLEQGSGRDRVRLVLNRFKKIPGLSDEDIDKVTSSKLLWKLPNNFHAVSPAIDKG